MAAVIGHGSVSQRVQHSLSKHPVPEPQLQRVRVSKPESDVAETYGDSFSTDTVSRTRFGREPAAGTGRSRVPIRFRVTANTRGPIPTRCEFPLATPRRAGSARNRRESAKRPASPVPSWTVLRLAARVDSVTDHNPTATISRELKSQSVRRTKAFGDGAARAVSLKRPYQTIGNC